MSAIAPLRPPRAVNRRSPTITAAGESAEHVVAFERRYGIAIARALVGPRRLLLADEPTGALDSVTGEDVMKLLRARCDQGAAAVMVTHDARLAGWSDRVVFLRDGAIVDDTGAPPAAGSLLTDGVSS
jgi:ABC-type phosphate/phosphonate transport system ATPase subunit